MATRSSIIVTGDLSYGTGSLVPAALSASRYEYFIGSASQGAYEMTANGKYRITLPGTTSESSIVAFEYKRYEVLDTSWYRTSTGYYGSSSGRGKTLTQLRSDTRIVMSRVYIK